MANEEQLAILRQGVEVWNKWREENPNTRIDLTQANLRRHDLRKVDLWKAELINANLYGADLQQADLIYANLHGADFRLADLRWANLTYADLTEANLSETDLNRANLSNANLNRANLSEASLSQANLKNVSFVNANLSGAYLSLANLYEANLSGADLSSANLAEAILYKANLSNVNMNKTFLQGAILVHANIDKARLTGSSIYGINVWDLDGEFEEQKDLLITQPNEPVITVDNIKIAQFIHLILNNGEIRDVINTLTSKAVLILGRFALTERKAILDPLRNKLREYDLLPIVFDFDRPTDKDFTETIKTLAGISYFVIADVTNPKSSPLELQATVPDYQIPFVPIIQEGESPFAMMVDLQKKYPWVLPTRSYDSIETLMSALKPGIIDPAVEMRNKLRIIKAQEQVTENLKDYLGKTL
jgi:uncharacterized protein YjbI with pentapeptide repeats